MKMDSKEESLEYGGKLSPEVSITFADLHFIADLCYMKMAYFCIDHPVYHTHVDL